MIIVNTAMLNVSLLLFFSLLIGCAKEQTTSNIEYKTVTERVEIPAVYKNVECKVYDLFSYNFNKLPDFDTLSYLGYININQFYELHSDNSKRTKMFENTDFKDVKEKFGLKCETKLVVSISGNYLFRLTSDDGSRFFINGNKIIDHDGLHGFTSKTANITLSEGVYSIKVEYFQNGGSKGLILGWKLPGGVETIIDEKSFE